MKKITLSLASILVFLFSFENSKANVLHEPDSTFPGPVHDHLRKIQHSPGFLAASLPKEKDRPELKKFMFSLAVTPRFKTTIPPLNVYFEHGIAGLASFGVSIGALYDSKPEIEYHSATVSVGARACGYAFPIISKIAGNNINSFGFQPYLGLVYDYYITAISVADYDIDPVHSSKFGLCAGTRWYPRKSKFGLLGEFNSNGIGSNIRFGISLGR